MSDALATLLGRETDTLAWWQMTLRAVVVYVAALGMIRLGEKRFLGKSTAFDVILAVILGSVVSRAVTGSSEFLPTLVAGFVLVGMHWLLAWASFRSDRLGTLVKGTPRTLVEDGAIRWDAMRKSHVSHDDLLSALRSEARVDDVQAVKSARLERSGDISVITREPDSQRSAVALRVVEVDVAEGVQRIRIEIV